MAVSASLLGQFLFTAAGGLLADYYGARHIMFTGDLVAAVSQFTAASLFISGAMNGAGIVTLSFISGIAAAMATPAIGAALKNIVPVSALNTANVLTRTGGTISRVVAGPLAGFLILVIQPGWLIAIDGATFACSAALLASVPAAVGASGGNLWANARQGWAEWVQLRWMVGLESTAAVINAARAGAITVLGPALVGLHPGGAAVWGLVSGAQLVGSIVVLWTLAGVTPHRVLVWALSPVLLTGLFVCGIALDLPSWALCLLGFGSGAGISFYGIKTDVIVQTHVPTQYLARISGLNMTLSLALSPLGPIISGILIHRMDSSTAELVWAAVIGVAVVASIFYGPIRRFTSTSTS